MSISFGIWLTKWCPTTRWAIAIAAAACHEQSLPGHTEITEVRRGAITALQVTAFEILGLPGLVVGQRVEDGCTFAIFFRLPHLITPERGITERGPQEDGVLSRKKQLSIAGIGGWVIELVNYLLDQRRMQAGLQFIDKQNSAVLNGLQDRQSQPEQRLGSVRFFQFDFAGDGPP